LRHIRCFLRAIAGILAQTTQLPTRMRSTILSVLSIGMLGVTTQTLAGPGFGVTVKVYSSGPSGGAYNSSGDFFQVALYAPGPEQDSYLACLNQKHFVNCPAPFTTSLDHAVPAGGETTFGYIEPNKRYVLVVSNNATHRWHAISVTAIDKPIRVDVGVPDGLRFY
jgi:hypothetical protein